MIQNCDFGHKVRNFVTIGTPHMGVEKSPNCHSGFMCDLLKYIEDNTYMNVEFQHRFAPASYWRDKSSEQSFEKYKKDSIFLAPLNNEIEHLKSA